MLSREHSRVLAQIPRDGYSSATTAEQALESLLKKARNRKREPTSACQA